MTKLCEADLLLALEEDPLPTIHAELMRLRREIVSVKQTHSAAAERNTCIGAMQLTKLEDASTRWYNLEEDSLTTTCDDACGATPRAGRGVLDSDAKLELTLYMLNAASEQFEQVNSAAAARTAELEKMLTSKLDERIDDLDDLYDRTCTSHMRQLAKVS